MVVLIMALPSIIVKAFSSSEYLKDLEWSPFSSRMKEQASELLNGFRSVLCLRAEGPVVSQGSARDVRVHQRCRGGEKSVESQVCKWVSPRLSHDCRNHISNTSSGTGGSGKQPEPPVGAKEIVIDPVGKN